MTFPALLERVVERGDLSREEAQDAMRALMSGELLEPQIGGLLVALGLFAAPVAFICSGSMAVAYFIIHQPEALFPIENHGDLAALYCWAFLPVAARGAGVWSVDAALSRRRR